MIGADGKKIVPVYGDSRPVEVRKNNVRIAGWVPSSKSGESVEFADTYNHEAEVLVSGKSEQAQTVQGKNLLDANIFANEALTYGAPGVIANIVVDEGRNCLKVRANTASLTTPMNLNIIFKADTQYAFKMDMKATSTLAWSAALYIYYTDGSILGLARHYSTGGIWGTVSLVSTAGKTISHISLGCVNTNNEIYASLFDLNSLQIEEGATATAYEPFVPDSPSPDYPSPVNSAGECNLVSRGKNLLYIPHRLTTGATIVSEDDEYIVTKGINNVGGGLAIPCPPLKTNTDYTLVQTVATSAILDGRTRVFDLDKGVYIAVSLLAYNTNLSKIIGTFNTGDCSDNIVIWMGKNINYAQETTFTFKKDWMLLEGVYTIDNIPEYEKAVVPSNNPLPPLPGINAKNTYNPMTGEYVQRIGVKVFDGTEALLKTSNPPHINTVNNMINTCINLPGPNPTYLGFSTHNKHANASQLVEGINRINDYIWITLSFDRLGYTSGDDARPLVNAYLAAQYVAGTPVTVYYQLATPVTTYLAPAQVPTYYPYTKLEQDGAVKGTIEATVKVME